MESKLNKIKIQYENGSTRIWINDVELESVQKCLLDLDAKRNAVAKLEIHIDKCEVEEIIDNENVKKITRE